MDSSTALQRLHLGIEKLDQKKPAWDRRERYHRGDQDLPYAPPGVSREYMELREQSAANWLKIAMAAPVQRCRAEGIRTSQGSDQDAAFWTDFWKSNRLGSRQEIVFTEAMVHGRGVMSVSADPKTKAKPRVRVESDRRVHIEGHEDDPFKPQWAIKRIVLPGTSPLVDANGRGFGSSERAWSYDDSTWFQFDRKVGAGNWQETLSGRHTLEDVPFVPFDVGIDADGVPHSAMEPLIPAQDAITTIRFNALLALQFAAYQQRAVTGYDPVVRDANGDVVFRKDETGGLLLDTSGQPIPVTSQLGRPGVDRLIAFPSPDTKIWDFTESNLDNYVTLYHAFLTDLFGRGQVPPQYLLDKMANLSGDALAGAESTLTALVSDLQRGWDESLLHAARLARRAQGDAGAELLDGDIIWGDGEARSFAQTVDAIVKLISVGFPREAAFGMLPGANPERVRHWIELSDAERQGLDAAVIKQVERDLANATAP